MTGHATFSPCGTYRYWLERTWSSCGDYLNFVMLNPSTADAEINDPTIRKCIGFAQRWGYIGLHVVNLFALRSTDPRALKRHADPIGPVNDHYIEASMLSSPRTIVAWGNGGNLNDRAKQVRELLAKCRTVEALRLNQDGSPAHPLYIPYDVVPVPFL